MWLISFKSATYINGDCRSNTAMRVAHNRGGRSAPEVITMTSSRDRRSSFSKHSSLEHINASSELTSEQFNLSKESPKFEQLSSHRKQLCIRSYTPSFEQISVNEVNMFRLSKMNHSSNSSSNHHINSAHVYRTHEPTSKFETSVAHRSTHELHKSNLSLTRPHKKTGSGVTIHNVEPFDSKRSILKNSKSNFGEDSNVERSTTKNSPQILEGSDLRSGITKLRLSTVTTNALHQSAVKHDFLNTEDLGSRSTMNKCLDSNCTENVGKSSSSSNISNLFVIPPHVISTKIDLPHQNEVTEDSLFFYFNVSDAPPQDIDPKTVTLFVKDMTKPELKTSTNSDDIVQLAVKKETNRNPVEERGADFFKNQVVIDETFKLAKRDPPESIAKGPDIDRSNASPEYPQKIPTVRVSSEDTFLVENQNDVPKFSSHYRASEDGDFKQKPEVRVPFHPGKKIIPGRLANKPRYLSRETFSVPFDGDRFPDEEPGVLDDGALINPRRKPVGSSNMTRRKDVGFAGRGSRVRADSRRKGGRWTTEETTTNLEDEEDDGSYYYDDSNGYTDKDAGHTGLAGEVKNPGQGNVQEQGHPPPLGQAGKYQAPGVVVVPGEKVSAGTVGAAKEGRVTGAAGTTSGKGVPLQNVDPYGWSHRIPKRKTTTVSSGLIPSSQMPDLKPGVEGIREPVNQMKNVRSRQRSPPSDKTFFRSASSLDGTGVGYCIFYSEATLFYRVASLVLFFSNVVLVIYTLVIIRSHMDEIDKKIESSTIVGSKSSSPIVYVQPGPGQMHGPQPGPGAQPLLEM